MNSATLLKSTLTSCLLFFNLFIGISKANGQTVEMFNYTGGQQQWIVPNCVTSITVVVAGAEGGGNLGGNGAVITSVIPVVPGQVIDINVGGQGGAGAAGYGGGGTGHLSMDGNIAFASYGGGGASTLTIGGQPYIIAAGGGGTSGGSDPVAGGNGGCLTGFVGIVTWGFGGGGGTQVAGGAGGVPWNNVPPGGQAGMLGQGGFGGPWNTASGGGGGGGLYGGGGGGNDGCCTGANGGGGGGGGSSLIPLGDLCDAGTNTGNGYVSITYIEGINPTAENSGPYCSNQTIELFGNLNGGNGNYSWTGPNGFTSNELNPTILNANETMAGIYTLMLTGNTVCNDTIYAITEVVVHNTPNVNPQVDRTFCNGEIVNIENFTGSSLSSTYSWTNSTVGVGLGQNGNGNILPFVGNASAFDQTATIIVEPSENGCVGLADTFLITVYREPLLSVSNDTIICQNGTVDLMAQVVNPGNGTYVYHWNHTPNTQGDLIENPTISTTYTVFATNLNGCHSDTLDIEVNLRNPLIGNISEWDTICPNSETSIAASVNGGLGEPYTFVWSTGTTYTGDDEHAIDLSPNESMNYSVTISDECESTPIVLMTNIHVSALPVPDFTILNPNQCEPAIFEIVNSTDPLYSQQVDWLINGSDQYINQDTITTNQLWGGKYDLQMIVTSFDGCVDSITIIDALNVNHKPYADFNFSPNPVTMFNTEVFFQNYSTNADSYQWSFQDAFPGYSEQSNVHVQFPEGIVGQYEVMLIALSELGCSDTSIQTVMVVPEVIIYAPNSFTPDGDEFNQTWSVFMEGIDQQNFELLIYNRWGEVIWETKDVNVAWDGTYKNQIAPTGTYTWTIRTKDLLNDSKYTYSGIVNVLR